MPQLIDAPSVIASAGNKPKVIEEYVGRVNSGHQSLSVARMKSPSGWREPGQRPEFEEVTVVLAGMLRVEHDDGVLEVPTWSGNEFRWGDGTRARIRTLTPLEVRTGTKVRGRSAASIR